MLSFKDFQCEYSLDAYYNMQLKDNIVLRVNILSRVVLQYCARLIDIWNYNFVPYLLENRAYCGMIVGTVSKFRIAKGLEPCLLTNSTTSGTLPTPRRKGGPFQPCCFMMWPCLRGIHQCLVTMTQTLWEPATNATVATKRANVLHTSPCQKSNMLVPMMKMHREAKALATKHTKQSQARPMEWSLEMVNHGWFIISKRVLLSEALRWWIMDNL